MARAIEEIERDIGELSAEERSALLRMLIAGLDAPADEDVETAWLEQSQRRYQELAEGRIKGVSGPLVFERLRLRLGQ